MRILVVDDDKNILEMIKFNLELDQHIVYTASNGQEGIEVAKRELPELILMDWMMPVMTGLEATKIIKKESSLQNIPIFMLTAKTQISDFDVAFAAGANNYITKPFDPVDLSQIIETKLEKFKNK